MKPSGVKLPPDTILRWGTPSLDDFQFDIVVEPLTFGIVPRSTWSTIAAVLVMAAIGFTASKYWVMPALQKTIKEMEREETQKHK